VECGYRHYYWNSFTWPLCRRVTFSFINVTFLRTLSTEFDIPLNKQGDS
jgi:hypothetical protein